VWADTPDGLARLVDGYWITPEQCGPGAGSVMEMAQDAQASLWVLTDHGLYRHSQGQWQHLVIADEMAPGMPVSILVDSYGRVWYVSEGALAVYQQGAWTSVDLLGLPEAARLRDIAITDAKTAWLATDQGLYKSQGGPWMLVTPALSAVDVPYLVSSAQGDLWAASEGAIARYSGGRWAEYLRGVDVPDSAVTTLVVASDGTLWAGTAGAGLLHHNERGWSQFTSLHGLAHNNVERLIETSEGALWAVTPYGISRFAPAP
jgi:ligand-binding sensor domain-containing protein